MYVLAERDSEGTNVSVGLAWASLALLCWAIRLGRGITKSRCCSSAPCPDAEYVGLKSRLVLVNVEVGNGSMEVLGPIRVLTAPLRLIRTVSKDPS